MGLLNKFSFGATIVAIAGTVAAAAAFSTPPAIALNAPATVKVGQKFTIGANIQPAMFIDEATGAPIPTLNTMVEITVVDTSTTRGVTKTITTIATTDLPAGGDVSLPYAAGGGANRRLDITVTATSTAADGSESTSEAVAQIQVVHGRGR